MSATAHLPEQFGRYRIVKLLGSGAMGSVYLARDTNLDRDVALKVPRFIDGKEPQIIARFYQEARAAATVHHPHVCPVYDVGETDGVHYLTMAFIEGKPLEQWVGSGKPLNQRQVATIGRKVADAIGEAHKKGVIHRDLKPANIMIDKRGEPVVMDFGLARRARADDTRLTRAGTVLGSPAYMSPEQIRGDTDTTGPATDIFSLGVILYELLARRLPFDGDTIGAVHAQILMDDPPPLRDFHPDLEPALEAVVLKALAKKVEDRFPTMGQMAAALKAYLDGKAATDPGPTRAPTATVASPPASSALHGSAFAGRSLVLAEKEEHEPHDIRPKKKKKQGSKDGAKKPPVWGLAAGGAVVLAVVVGLVIALRPHKQPEHAGTPDAVPVNGGTGPGGDGGTGTRPAVAEQVNAGGKERPPSAAGDLGRLQGEWVVEAEEWKGEPVAPDEIRQQSKRLVFDGDRLTFHRQGKDRALISTGTVRVTPGTIDFTGTDYFGQSREFRGIFELTGDTLRLAYPNTNAGLVRPTAFASSADGDTLVVVARRKRPIPAAEFRQLFNGKNLTGWKVDNGPDLWRVEGGTLTGKAGQELKPAIVTDRDYSDFVLRLEYKFAPGTIAAVTFRNPPGPGNPLAVMLVDDGSPPAGAMRTGAFLGWKAPDRAADLRRDDWNRLELTVRGNTVAVRANGAEVNGADLTASPNVERHLGHPAPAAGRIGLQVANGTVHFRNIEVQNLTPAAGSSGK